MNEFSGLLTITVFLPLAGGLVIAVLIRGDRNVRYFAGAVALAELLLSIVVFVKFDRGDQKFQLLDRAGWIDWLPQGQVQYLLGVDGLSAPLVLLTGLLGMAAVFASWGIKHRVREYFVWLLVLQTAVMGVFVSLDFLLFFIFWELELLPMFFLISIWGRGRKEYSAMKFVIFTSLFCHQSLR